MRPAWLPSVLLVCACVCACADEPGQHEITRPGVLLGEDGRLREPGWAPRQLLEWNPERVHNPDLLRQWDFFSVWNGAAAVNLTLVDLGFIQVAQLSVVDFATGVSRTGGALKGGSGVLVLSPGVEGSASLTPANATQPVMTFETTSDTTTIAIDMPASSIFGEAAQGSFTIHRRPTMPYLSLATPFDEDPHFFFFEQKVPGMSAEGTITIGGETWTFAPTDSAAILDWGRGVWPDEVTWRWGAASGEVDGVPLALNLGDGFGDDRAGTENLVVHGDVPHKLGRVTWTHDVADPMADWTFESTDGRLSLTLHPIAHELNDLDFGPKFSRLRKAYGTFSGTIILSDGHELPIHDLHGFAERMDLSW